MTTNWAQWEGQVIDGECRLGRYLGGSEHSGVFATEFRGNKAAIKLRVGERRSEPGVELSHPHLLPIYRAGRGQLDGTPVWYVVMELADEVLASFIPERALEAEEARETLAPVLDALAYLHARGLVHGHIKPANIMSVGEKLKISSDGLRRSDEAAGRPETPTPYDAPEIAEGRLAPASDVWSLGMTLVEMLTQHLPGAGSDGEPPVPATLPPAFRDIASHCLRRDPQRRWTVSQISDRLAGRAPVEPIMPPRAEAPVAIAQPQATIRKRSTTAFIVGVLAILVAIGSVFFRSRPASEAPPAAPATAAQPETSAPAPPPEKREAAPPKRMRGKVEHEAMPDVAAKALETIDGRVRVRVAVKVDPMGNVVATKLDTPRVSRYFATAALQAARRWKFTPPTEDGNAVASSWALEFDFGRAGVQMHSRQVS
ncbi:MAG TPA: TonB family protein [Bryobacteraceae bacterium]|nr:TonB family protein [Bryobacteraceae bacterium]